MTIGGKIVSFTMSTGEVSDTVTNYSVKVPGNVKVKLGVKRTVEAKRYKIMRKLYGSSTWTFDHYETLTECIHIRPYLIYVK